MGLQKNVSLLSLTFFGVGIIIGAGIYSVLGAAAAHAGNSLWISFILAAVVAVLTALSYCELATLFPFAGAEFVYLKELYPNSSIPSFLIAIFIIFAGSATSATVALGFASYLQEFFNISLTIAAFFLLSVITLINALGISNSSRVNIGFTTIEVLGLLIVIYFGLTHTSAHVPLGLSLGKGTLSAASLIFFVYLGFEDMANLAEETVDAHQNIPKSILLSLIITTILYIAVSIAVLQLAPLKKLAISQTPMALAMRPQGVFWENILSVIALFSTANTTLITMLAMSRMIYGVSAASELPEFFSRTTKTKKIPHNAIWLTWIMACLFLFIKKIELLANISSFCALVAFFVVNASLILFRYKLPQKERAFRSPVNIGNFPVLAFLGLLSVGFLLMQFNTQTYLISFIILIIGLILRLLLGMKRA